MSQCCETLLFSRGGEIGPQGVPGETGIQGIQGPSGNKGLDGIIPVLQPLKFVRIFQILGSGGLGALTFTIYESELLAAGLLKQDVYGNIEPGLFDIRVYVRHTTNPQNVWEDIRFNNSQYPSLVSIIASQSGDINVNINNSFFNSNFMYKVEVLG